MNEQKKEIIEATFKHVVCALYFAIKSDVNACMCVDKKKQSYCMGLFIFTIYILLQKNNINPKAHP